jgi:hypothetical protein
MIHFRKLENILLQNTVYEVSISIGDYWHAIGFQINKDILPLSLGVHVYKYGFSLHVLNMSIALFFFEVGDN